jgi:hypothetical protein
MRIIYTRAGSTPPLNDLRVYWAGTAGFVEWFTAGRKLDPLEKRQACSSAEVAVFL